MNEWKEVTLGEFCNITKLAGFEFTKYMKYNTYGEIIALRALNIKNGNIDLSDIKRIDKEVSDKLPRSKLFEGDILLTYTGNSYGDVAIVKENNKYHLAPNICKITTTNDANAIFVYQYVKSEYFREKMRNYIVGSSQPTIPMKTIRKLSIPLPPLPEQKVIADTLSCLDDKIELNNKINKNLEEMAQAIFKSWFVDFKPFKDGEFVDSEVGKIPKGWRVGTLNEIAEFKNGKKPVKTQGNIPIYGGNGIMGTSDTSNNEDVIIIGRVGAYCGNLFLSKLPCWISDNGIACKSKLTTKQGFCFQLLKNLYINKMNIGTSQPLLTQGILNSIVCLIPDKKVIVKYDNFFEDIYLKIFHNTDETQKLAQLRDTLLPKLMSGKVRVPVK